MIKIRNSLLLSIKYKLPTSVLMLSYWLFCSFYIFCRVIAVNSNLRHCEAFVSQDHFGKLQNSRGDKFFSFRKGEELSLRYESRNIPTIFQKLKSRQRVYQIYSGKGDNNKEKKSLWSVLVSQFQETCVNLHWDDSLFLGLFFPFFGKRSDKGSHSVTARLLFASLKQEVLSWDEFKNDKSQQVVRG